jgi:GntR family transcriptional repressor for pyruvate dehydrogenase complex
VEGVQTRTPDRPHRLNQLRMAEQVAAVLRDRIMTAEFGESAMLPKQDELVDEFGVSYPSVREALRILESEGLITIRRGNLGGALIHAPGPSTAGYALGLALQAMRVNVSDLGEALAFFEPASAARCALRSDRMETVVPILRQLITESEQHLTDHIQFTRVSRQFHDAIVSLNDNGTERLVMRSLASLWSAQEETWAQSSSSNEPEEYPTPDNRRQVIRAHNRILTAIEKGDDRLSERASRTHIEATQLYLLPRMKNEVIDASSPMAQAHYRALAKSR